MVVTDGSKKGKWEKGVRSFEIPKKSSEESIQNSHKERNIQGSNLAVILLSWRMNTTYLEFFHKLELLFLTHFNQEFGFCKKLPDMLPRIKGPGSSSCLLLKNQGLNKSKDAEYGFPPACQRGCQRAGERTWQKFRFLPSESR